MLFTLTCPNWNTSLYNSTTCELKKEKNYERGKTKGKKQTCSVFFFLQECVSAIVIMMLAATGFLSKNVGWASLAKTELPVDHT